MQIIDKRRERGRRVKAKKLTPIRPEYEEHVNIEEIKQGNFVRSWNEKTGRMSYKKVSNTFKRVAEGIYNLELSNGEIIQPTWNHPFWVLSTSPNFSGIDLSDRTSPLRSGKGTGDYPQSFAGRWTETKDLKVGDRLLAANGDIITVEDVSYDAGRVEVFNFEVEGNHTYFVGVDGVLVHNDNCSAEAGVSGATVESIEDLVDRYNKKNGTTYTVADIETLNGFYTPPSQRLGATPIPLPDGVTSAMLPRPSPWNINVGHTINMPVPRQIAICDVI